MQKSYVEKSEGQGHCANPSHPINFKEKMLGSMVRLQTNVKSSLNSLSGDSLNSRISEFPLRRWVASTLTAPILYMREKPTWYGTGLPNQR